MKNADLLSISARTQDCHKTFEILFLFKKSLPVISTIKNVIDSSGYKFSGFSGSSRHNDFMPLTEPGVQISSFRLFSNASLSFTKMRKDYDGFAVVEVDSNSESVRTLPA